VVLENCQPLRFPGCEFEAQPQAVSEVIERTGCSLLLDLGRARVSAAALGMDVHGYLSDLPLERTVHVHLSGPRMRDGRLFDAHEPMQETDYALLEWVLGRTHPQVVTVEYVRDAVALREQLVRLREVADTHS